MISLMYDGLELAKFERDDKGIMRLYKHENIPWSWLPFIFDINKNKDMSIIIDAWIKERVFPKNRIGAWFMLRKLGLRKYDVHKIAEITRCSVLTDPYWIAYEETDTFKENSMRGKLDSEEYPYNSLCIKDEENYIWRI